jgi:hypothetical protein
MKRRNLFYKIKPFLPRSVQVRVRRALVRRQLRTCGDVWPIDPNSRQAPPGWSGWPEGRAFALVLTHDVETRRGQDDVLRLAEIEKELGFRSSFNFVPERYDVSSELRRCLTENGFEVGVHDLKHDGSLFSSCEAFARQSPRINRYIREWAARGFRAGAMHHNLEWIGLLDIDYDASTFDTDPFEPQPDGVGTIFPFCCKKSSGGAFVELPYTLAQDFLLFILLKDADILRWTVKLDWIARQGGMALVNVHPDYIDFHDGPKKSTAYPVTRYRDFLEHCRDTYRGRYWNALPREVADFVRRSPMGADHGSGGARPETRNESRNGHD